MTKAIFAILILILVAFVGIILLDRSELARKRSAIDTCWNGVDQAMRARAAILPKAIETAIESLGQNADVVRGLNGAYSAFAKSATRQQKMEANGKMDSAIAGLLSASRINAALARDRNFVRIKDEFTRAEDEVSSERSNYNEAIKSYNISLELFPKNLCASLFRYVRVEDYFTIEEGSKHGTVEGDWRKLVQQERNGEPAE